MIPFEEIDGRLDKLELDRAWLAQATGRSPGAIRTALAPNAPAKNRSPLLQRALTEAIEAEEKRRRVKEALPDRITLEVDGAEFEAYSEAALAEGKTLKRWAIAALNEAARAARMISFPGNLGDAPRRQVSYVADAPYPKKGGVGYLVRMVGGVAAGEPMPGQVTEEDIPVGREYQEDHYALRVYGRSMEPKVPDGSVIIVRAWASEHTPKKGTIVVYSDAMGSTLKEFGYRRAKQGEEHDSMGNVPVLRSLNPAYSEVQTMEGGRIVAVLVEVL